MTTKEKIIHIAVDGGLILDPIKEERFIFLLNLLETECKIEALDNYEQKIKVYSKKSIS